jgi:hypothetical protein
LAGTPIGCLSVWVGNKYEEEKERRILLERRKTLIPPREAEVLAFSGTARLTTCGTPLSAGSEAAVGVLRWQEAGCVVWRLAT